MKEKISDKFSLPIRKFCTGEKKLVSFRIHEDLYKEMEKIAEDRQWSVSDVVQTAMDQFAQWHNRIHKKGGRRL